MALASDSSDEEILLALADDEDEGIALFIISNQFVTTAVLEKLLKRFPHAHRTIATTPNAPLSAMESVPVYLHTGRSLENYLERCGASHSERREFFGAFERSVGLDEALLLGIAWDVARRAAQRREEGGVDAPE